MLASCGIIRVIQEYMTLPPASSSDIRMGRQKLALTLSNEEGCRVILE